MNKKLYTVKVLLHLLSLVLLLALAACSAQTATSIAEADCDLACPADIQPDVVSGQAPKSTPSGNVPRISIEELRQKMESKADILIVDNRSKGEYDIDHIKGAISEPLATVVAGEWAIPVDKELVFYCAWPDEKTSARAALEPIDKGATDVKVLKGGYNAWKDAGYPMEEGSASGK